MHQNSHVRSGAELRLAIMQPYFFPYLGHFGLIAHSDEWVVFDTAQYTPKSWLNRNRVLHPSGGAMYITVPLRHASQSIAINQARLVDPASAHQSILGKLAHYRRAAPYFTAVTGLVDEAFAEGGSGSLVQLNVASLAAVCGYLGIRFRFRVWSEAEIKLPPVDHPGGWAPHIASALGASEYLNPVGGYQLFRPEDFDRLGISLSFLKVPPFVYDTGPFSFVPNLSVLDVLMWNPPERARAALSAASIVAPDRAAGYGASP
jgi:hypothetical protein